MMMKKNIYMYVCTETAKERLSFHDNERGKKLTINTKEKETKIFEVVDRTKRGKEGRGREGKERRARKGEVVREEKPREDKGKEEEGEGKREGREG